MFLGMGVWQKGEPKESGWYVLEFSSGDRFVVAQGLRTASPVLVLENVNTGAYISDSPVRHLSIPSPQGKT